MVQGVSDLVGGGVILITAVAERVVAGDRLGQTGGREGVCVVAGAEDRVADRGEVPADRGRDLDVEP